MSRRQVAAALALLALTACVSVSKTVLTNDFLSAPVHEGSVYVLLSSIGDFEPRQTCTRVAVLYVSGDGSEAQINNKLRKEAGKLGANTVYIDYSEAIALHCDP